MPLFYHLAQGKDKSAQTNGNSANGRVKICSTGPRRLRRKCSLPQTGHRALVEHIIGNSKINLFAGRPPRPSPCQSLIDPVFSGHEISR